MGLIHVTRIEQKLLAIYESFIDMSDYSDKPKAEYDNALRSRAVAAHSICMFTGASSQSCAASITDGFGDMGIDAVYNDIDAKTLYLVQTKWVSSGEGSPALGDILKFINGFKKILVLDFNGANSKLIAKKSDIEAALNDSDYKINLLIGYTGSQSLSQEASEVMNNLMKDLNDTSDVVEYSVVAQKQLYDSISGGVDGAPITIDDIDLREWGRLADPYLTYYGYIGGETIAQWWQQFGNRLFAKNIRLFKGSSEANAGMIKTLNESPKDFWYFNNGIKVLCDSINKKPIYGDDRSVGLFTAKGLSIVNGAQTVGCISTVYSSNPDKVKDAKVFIQFVSLENAPEGYDMIVTRLTNTQNKIDGQDFASLDPEQERIRRELWLDDITYHYKAGSKNSITKNDIVVEEAAIALACYTGNIGLATLTKRNPGAIFENITKPPYTDIFNSKTNAILLRNSVLVLRTVEDELLSQRKKYSGKKQQALIHGNRFIVYTVMQHLEIRQKLYYNIPIEDIKSNTNLTLIKIIPLLHDAIEKEYPDNYLNSLFKNSQKCGVLYNIIDKIMKS